MLRNGTHPHLLDRRDVSLHRTFPHFGAIVGPLTQMSYTYDAGLTMPNQNQVDVRFNPPLPARPFGCTGETTVDICGDEDGVVYDFDYTYRMTCAIEGHDTNQGCDIRNAMKSLTVYGLRKNGESEAQALSRKRGEPYYIDKLPGRDWYDSFRLALRGNKRSISCGTPWFPELELISTNGRIDSNFPVTGTAEDYPWHDTKICGEIIFADGTDALRMKSWQGKEYGDNGWCYPDRAAFNKMFDTFYGTIGATPGPKVTDQDIKYVRITLIQTMMDYINRLLSLLAIKPLKIYA